MFNKTKIDSRSFFPVNSFLFLPPSTFSPPLSNPVTTPSRTTSVCPRAPDLRSHSPQSIMSECLCSLFYFVATTGDEGKLLCEEEGDAGTKGGRGITRRCWVED
ncbi:hypothetical protein A2U01_0059938 [Trifolium medium]|uniref:Uncharacterized protein n=1 Tax=Trifolium medium TaxID=97028 RepID=A0A392RQX0_9FABA|nr:hypothetical protein [Trifolium medium]